MGFVQVCGCCGDRSSGKEVHSFDCHITIPTRLGQLGVVTAEIPSGISSQTRGSLRSSSPHKIWPIYMHVAVTSVDPVPVTLTSKSRYNFAGPTNE
jgi:hypothetical protein